MSENGPGKGRVARSQLRDAGEAEGLSVRAKLGHLVSQKLLTK